MAAVWIVLVHVVLPLWALCGFLDYLCHRVSHIERANGVRESLVHWLMLAEVGLPLGLAVFFRIDTLVLVTMLVFLVVHEVTGHFDLRLAMATRRVTVFEHQVHSFLEIMPLTAMLLVMALHWPQAQALFGWGMERADWSLALKPAPRWREVARPAGVLLVLVLLPYAEELARGLLRRVRGRSIRGNL